MIAGFLFPFAQIFCVLSLLRPACCVVQGWGKAKRPVRPLPSLPYLPPPKGRRRFKALVHAGPGGTTGSPATESTRRPHDGDFALQRERKRNDGSSYQTWPVARVCRLIENVGKRQVNYLQPVDPSVPPSSPIHITAQFYSETGGMFTLGPVDLTAVYCTRSVIAVLKMQTRDPKIISHTGQVDSEATYTIHPDDRAMLCDYIARLPSAPKTAVSASKAGRRFRSREAMGPQTA